MEKIDGQLLTVKANNGQSPTVKMADNFTVMGIAKAGIADVARYRGSAIDADQNSRG